MMLGLDHRETWRAEGVTLELVPRPGLDLGSATVVGLLFILASGFLTIEQQWVKVPPHADGADVVFARQPHAPVDVQRAPSGCVPRVLQEDLWLPHPAEPGDWARTWGSLDRIDGTFPDPNAAVVERRWVVGLPAKLAGVGWVVGLFWLVARQQRRHTPVTVQVGAGRITLDGTAFPAGAARSVTVRDDRIEVIDRRGRRRRSRRVEPLPARLIALLRAAETPDEPGALAEARAALDRLRSR